MRFINSKITIHQIKRNPFFTSLKVSERSANNQLLGSHWNSLVQQAALLMATIITLIGGLVTSCARRRYHYVTNIPNPWRLACKPLKCHRKEITYEQNQWSSVLWHFILVFWNVHKLDDFMLLFSKRTQGARWTEIEYSCSSTFVEFADFMFQLD